MGRRKKRLTERFTKEYKRSKTEHINTVFLHLINRKHNGKDFTIHMITNWFYSRNENVIIDDVFEMLMGQFDPIGLRADKAKIEESVMDIA